MKRQEKRLALMFVEAKHEAGYVSSIVEVEGKLIVDKVPRSHKAQMGLRTKDTEPVTLYPDSQLHLGAELIVGTFHQQNTLSDIKRSI